MRDEDVKSLPYFLEEEVIGSSSKYHRPTCPAIRLIKRRNLKRLRNWQEAVALGLDPCPSCAPAAPHLRSAPAKRRVGF
jgi:methylphosphotriester-DNA--protein-cysteine methyltransferase